MTTDELVARLASDTKPVRTRPVRQVVCPQLALGAVASIGVAVLFTGMSQSLPTSAHCVATFGRIMIALGLASIGLAMLLPSLRPGPMSPWLGRSLLAISIVLVAGITVQLAGRPPNRWIVMIAGTSVARSPAAILLLALPVFVALVRATRKEAPTELRLTGGALGLVSGSVGAAACAIVCTDVASTALFAWYGVGIGAATLAGFVAGPRLLRW